MFSQVTPPPPVAPGAADPRSHALAEALASLRDQAKNIRTPTALGADLLAEALLQRRYGLSSVNPSPAMGEGPSPAPQALSAPSPSPGVPPPSAPSGTASAAPAASSPAAGAAVTPLAPEGLALGAAPVPSPSPTLVDALKAYVLGALAPAGRAPEQGQDQGPNPGSP